MLDRRRFLSFIPAATALGAMLSVTPHVAAAAGRDPRGVGAIETLMRGHGLLLRALIIYDVITDRIGHGQETDPSLILKTVGVFHEYLEGFHENAEEKHIFAPMEKANIAFASIQELKIQHGTGYELTQRITSLAKAGKQTPELVSYLNDFIRMYRHHAAWEDTVVFPAFDAMESRNDLSELAATLDSEEKTVLGHSGFGSFVNQLADVEKQLGIYELSTSTPKLS